MAKRILVPISPREPADSFIAAVALDGVPVEIAVRFGDPARAIPAEADAFGADLIALGQ